MRLADGRVLIAGNFSSSTGSPVRLARLHVDGAMDHSFDKGAGLQGRIRARRRDHSRGGRQHFQANLRINTRFKEPLGDHRVVKARPVRRQFQKPWDNQPLHLQLWLRQADPREDQPRKSKFTGHIDGDTLSDPGDVPGPQPTYSLCLSVANNAAYALPAKFFSNNFNILLYSSAQLEACTKV